MQITIPKKAAVFSFRHPRNSLAQIYTLDVRFGSKADIGPVFFAPRFCKTGPMDTKNIPGWVLGSLLRTTRTAVLLNQLTYTFFMQFVLQFSNIIFQVGLPFPEEDRPLLTGERNVSTAWFGNPWLGKHEEMYGKVACFKLDLSSPDLKASEQLPLSMRFEHVQEVELGAGSPPASG